MAQKTFSLTIRTPEGTAYECQAVSIKMTTEGGDIKVLARHASLTTTIACSPIWLEGVDFSEEFFARQGVFFFDNTNNSAVLMALYCEPKKIINKQTIQEYLEFLEQQLAEGQSLSQFQVKYLETEKIGVERQLKSVN